MHFEASADIQAPADRIWKILTDAPSYPAWDSGVTKVEGSIADGDKKTIDLRLMPAPVF